MTLPPADQVAAYVVAFASFCMAIGERWNNRKKVEKTEHEDALLANAKMHEAKCELLLKAADDNLALFNKERDEHAKTRDYWHQRAQEFQQSLSQCQDKLSILQAKPDFSDMMKFIEAQSQTSLKILQGIEAILAELRPSIHKP